LGNVFANIDSDCRDPSPGRLMMLNIVLNVGSRKECSIIAIWFVMDAGRSIGC